jgi:hypothetical protein
VYVVVTLARPNQQKHQPHHAKTVKEFIYLGEVTGAQLCEESYDHIVMDMIVQSHMSTYPHMAHILMHRVLHACPPQQHNVRLNICPIPVAQDALQSPGRPTHQE